MARITFKQFLQLNESEGSEFISGTMEKMPKKYEEVEDPNDPTKTIKRISKAYTDAVKKFSNFPSDTEKLKVDFQKPEGTEFDPREVPKVVRSGGKAKEHAEKQAGIPKTNDYFYGRSDFFNIDPHLYTPQNMLMRGSR